MAEAVQIDVIELRPKRWRFLDALLSSDEIKRRDSLIFERDRQAFTVCRAALRCRLADRLSIKPEQVRFRLGPYGKPHLHDDAVAFNVSHSQDLGLIATTKQSAVGVDIEFSRPLDDLWALADDHFSPSENKALRTLDPHQQVMAFYRIWSCKEAFIKAIGLGLSCPLDSFDVAVEPDQDYALTAVRHPDYAQSDWILSNLEVDRGYSAAVVVPESAEISIRYLANPFKSSFG